MTYRVRRHTTSRTFKVNGQLCKVFLEPCNEYEPGYWIWNVGFAIGKSRRQINDWYWKRKNKRRRTLTSNLTGKTGIKAIKTAFNTVLEMRWAIEPGDCLMLDCTSKEPLKQFNAWYRWHKHHPEWAIDYQELKYYWYRPPFPSDKIWQNFDIVKVLPEDLLANTHELNYFNCFRAFPKNNNNTLQTELSNVLMSWL